VIYVCVTDFAMLTHAKRTFSSRYDRSSLACLFLILPGTQDRDSCFKTKGWVLASKLKEGLITHINTHTHIIFL
jgi:hypothetical protein